MKWKWKRHRPTPQDLDDELQSHLEALRQERLDRGDSPEAAARYAHQHLGNRTAIAEDVHQVDPWSPFANALYTLRMAARSVTRHRKTTGPATAILSLGIAMSVAMFSLVDAVLLRPLPFPRQESIEVIWKVDAQAGHYIEELAYPELRDLQDNIRDLEYVAVMPTSLYGYARVLQHQGREPVQIESAPVSHDFFRVLGVEPALGRNFRASDERVNAAPVVILSDRVWREHFNSDPHIIGRMIRLNGDGNTVIGVMAPGVDFPRGAGFWRPLGIDRNIVERRNATYLQAIARRRPGSSHAAVERQIDSLFQRLANQYPQFYSPSQRASVMTLPVYWTGSSRPQLWILLGASILLLTASVLSAGILILSGVVARRIELATRIALGAARWRILTQLAAEGGFIAITATLAGSALSLLALPLLTRWAPADIPRVSDAHLDPAALTFAVAAAILAAIVCTLIPAGSALNQPLEPVLREGSTRSSLSRSGLRTRNWFICAQATVAALMLALAGLFVASYHALSTADIGFAHRDTLTFNLALHGPGPFGAGTYSVGARRAFYNELLHRLRETPGVLSAAAILVRPLEGPIGWERDYEFAFEAGKQTDRVLPKANYESITTGYFATVGTPLLEGRDFNDHDVEGSPSVVIISQSLARRIRAAGHSPVGHQLRFGPSLPWLTIVGVTADARYRNIAQQDADLFVPAMQAQPSTPYLVIRGTQSTTELAKLVRRTLAQLDPSQAAAREATLGELIDANTARNRFHMILLLAFGAAALLLAATAIYGVIAELMSARRQEIAIRTALGSPRARLMRDMIRSTLLFAAVGALAGTSALLFLRDHLTTLLYAITPTDPTILLSSAAFVLVVNLAAACWPAWRAVDRPRIDFT